MMYKRFIIIIVFLFTTSLSANNNNLKIIELHKNKSLDQLVLEKKDESVIIESEVLKVEENLDENETNEYIEENNALDNAIEKNEILESSESLETITEEQITIINKETIFDLDEVIINDHFNTIKNIQSTILYQEFIKILSNIELDDENFSNDKLYLVIKKLYEIGEIEKAYNLVKKTQITNISNQDYLNFFYTIELNYLYSLFDLEKVCELKNSLSIKSISLPKKLLEKTDVFCLTLDNRYAEAKLLNSVLLESEKEIDQNFQKLFSYMILDKQESNTFEPLSNIKTKELIFMYSAMLRINELPLDKDFIEVDSKNLSIPVILSDSTDMETRIKAANKAYYDDVLSINSLAALYQSVDFDSKQFSNPKETIANLNSQELTMAYYYQLATKQIFPDERLNVILEYWNFAKKSGLDKISYSITKQIIDTFSPTSENAEYAMQIAFAHIANSNFDDALKWINLFEVSNSKNESVEYAKLLINLNKNDDLSTIKNYLTNNYNSFNNINDQTIHESLQVLITFLNIQNITPSNLSYTKISDSRSMPSYFLIQDINYNIELKNDLSVFIQSLISMNNKKWTELHPEHLKLILNAYNLYDNGVLIKKIIIEILNELEIF